MFICYCLSSLLLLQQVTGDCGVIRKVGVKVVGGETVKRDIVYPWYVALTKKGVPLSQLSVSCGGSLITDRHVLTAAHCYADASKASRATLYRLVYLLQDRCTPSRVLASPQAKSVEIHAKYDGNSLDYDIALITLEKKTNLSPVCLPRSKSVSTGDGEVIGYGSLQPRANRYPCEIQRVTLPIISKSQCLRTGIGSVVKTLTGVICAGKKEGGIDSCDGDSGGPLQTKSSDGRYTIKGIVSFGYGCARKDQPGVYTDVAYFIDWLNPRISGASTNPPTAPRPTPKPTSRPWFNIPIPNWLNSTINGIFRPRISSNSSLLSNGSNIFVNDTLCT